MENAKEHLEQLREIRSLMERSTRFISLSGLSGVVAGFLALLGSGLQFWYSHWQGLSYTHLYTRMDYIFFTALNFFAILVLSLSFAFFFTYRKALSQGQKIWDPTVRRMLINICVPLLAGAGFAVILYIYGLIGLVAPATLIFYGLALVSGSQYTFSDIRYLGLSEIVLGFVACFAIGYGLLFWALGFGVLHIFYGTIMYYKYDRKVEPDYKKVNEVL